MKKVVERQPFFVPDLLNLPTIKHNGFNDKRYQMDRSRQAGGKSLLL